MSTAGAKAPGNFNVLVIEDDANIARLVEANLQKAKLECRHAPNGRDGLIAFAQREPHLVLLDLMLPDTNGYEVCAKIRQRSGVPIIMMTARTQTEDQLHGLKVGADDYVTKPFDPQLLVARVVAQLRRVHRYDASAEQKAGEAGGAPSNWSTCHDCGYMGPNEKFEELSETFRLTMVCPHCNTRLKQELLPA